jgi:hypothetical protein
MADGQRRRIRPNPQSGISAQSPLTALGLHPLAICHKPLATRQFHPFPEKPEKPSPPD